MGKRDNDRGTYHIPEMERDWPAEPELGLGAGEAYSVTTVLRVIAKPALVGWAAKLERQHVLSVADNLCVEGDTPERPGTILDWGSLAPKVKAKLEADGYAHTKVLTNTSEEGSSLHHRIATGTPGSANVEAQFLAYQEWLQGGDMEVQEQELLVWHPELRVAGTLDLVVSGPLFAGVVDIKTSDSAIYNEHLIQVAAYLAAYKAPGGTSYEQAGILRIPRSEKERARLTKRLDHPYEWRMLSRPELAQAHAAMSAAIELHNAMLRLKNGA